MNVSDVKAIEPLAECYEFDPLKQYIIYVPFEANIKAMLNLGRGVSIRAQIIPVDCPADIKIVEKLDGSR